VGISPHVARLRAALGHELIVLPSVSVLPVDASGRLLLAQVANNDSWHIIGGAVEPGESPAEAGMRECMEEIGVPVRLTGLLGAFGGPGYEVTYPNGDQVAYVTVAYTATIVSGVPVADGDELAGVGWFRRDALRSVPLGRFARSLLTACGYLDAAT
jgi:8-oxo-dGTP pyrophosphatase MutT (NUDIX family)